MMKYLEDCDDAFLNIDYMLKDQPEYRNCTDGTMYSNATKRSTFITYFTVPDLTADLIDNVADNTTTWDEMATSLRKRIARRMDNARLANKRRAHTLSSDLSAYDSSSLQSVAPAIEPASVNSVTQALSVLQDVCVNALGQEWRIGSDLWQKLTPELHKKILDLCHQHLPLASGGVTASHHKESPKPSSGPQEGNRDLIKAPPKPNPQAIGMQYSGNKVQAETEEEESTSDEEVQTLLQCLNSINKLNSQPQFFNARTFQTVRAHTNYWALNFNSSVDICIVDSGADSHVGGDAWLPLSPLSGPTVQRANVIGFDETSTRKNGLPIVAAVTRVETNEGPMLLRAKHLIYNQTSKQTLLSTFQMRQLGLIVDDVSRQHWKDKDKRGTQTIIFPDTSIDLILRAALFTFKISKPTLEEYANTPDECIIDVGLDNWIPISIQRTYKPFIPFLHLPVVKQPVTQKL